VLSIYFARFPYVFGAIEREFREGQPMRGREGVGEHEKEGAVGLGRKNGIMRCRSRRGKGWAS